MYRSDLDAKDRGGALTAVVAIHAALLFALLHLSGRIDLADPQSVLRTFDVIEVPPPPVPPLARQKATAKPKQKEGGSSPRNIKSEATPVTAPKPKVEPQRPNPVVVAEVPRQGTAPTQGASTVVGPGTGAGGSGNGNGSGMGGNGPGGGGGGGGIAVPVRLVRGIGGRDYPREIMASWPGGGRIDVILRVEVNGRVSSCRVGRSFGNPMADQWTCALITQRGQFRPALDRSGRPVAGWFGYSQAAR